jgi:hemerythrin
MARPSAPAAAAKQAKKASPQRQTARRRIDDEHRQLGEMLRSLAHTRDLHKIEKLLGELYTLLVQHFEGEEGEQGLHSVVSEGAAHRITNLQQLFEEHREILARLDELRAATAAALAGPVSEITLGISRLSDTLRRHEEEEERLFGEAFYTDLGGRSS